MSRTKPKFNANKYLRPGLTEDEIEELTRDAKEPEPTIVTQEPDDEDDNDGDDAAYKEVDVKEEDDEPEEDTAEEAEMDADNDPKEDNDDSEEDEESEDEEDATPPPPRRSERASRPVTRYEPSGMQTERSFYQKKRTKKVMFKDEVEKANRKKEYCHNLTAQVHPNPDEDVEYAPDLAMMIARTMNDLRGKVTVHGASYSQQYMLHKGLKKFGKKGSEASKSKLDQLH